jgi:ATP synthase protein I
VARDSKDTRERGKFPLNEGSFGSGPAAQFMGLGLQFVLSLLLFLYIGKWVDGKLGTSPWFLILGVFTGATAAFYSMYRKLKAVERQEEAQDKLDKERQ